eukprot:scaffold9130_cov124-Isochrysis_galbana.AAC.4
MRRSSLSSAPTLSLAKAAKCARLEGLTVCGCSLFGSCSLKWNNIGAEGTQHIGKALKINRTLTSLECALASPRQSCQMCSLCCEQLPTGCGCSLFGPHSLMDNKIGDEGTQHIGEALKTNKALTSLKYAPAPRHNVMRLLCCQQGPTAVMAPCLALAVFPIT